MYRLLSPTVVGELARFAASGLLSYGLGISLAWFFSEVALLREEVSVALCLVILLIANFFVDRNFVFRAAGAKKWQFVSFVAASASMRGFEYLVFLALLRVFNLNYLIALTIGMVLSNALKFVLYRSFVFKRLGNR